MRLLPPLLLALGLLAACGGREEMPPSSGPPVPASEVDLERKLAGIHADLPGLESRRGEWIQGDATGRLQARFRGDDLVFVEEALDLGDYGSGRRRYYFEDDRLFYATAREERVRMDGSGRSRTELSLRFTPAGTAIEGRKAMDGDSVDVTPEDVRQVRLAVDRIRDALAPVEVQRIRFAGGTWSALLTGTADHSRGRSYVVDADAGETLRLTVEPEAARFAVLDPAGDTLVDTTGFWIGELAAGGDHMIRIYSPAGPLAYTFRIELR
jgi:hypothetical protein